MAIDGYTESQYEQLVREVGNDRKLTHGPKRRHDDSSYEVFMMHPVIDGYILTSSKRTIPMIRRNRRVNR